MKQPVKRNTGKAGNKSVSTKGGVKMLNLSPFTGTDAVISLAVEGSPAGDAAKSIVDTYSLTPVGRVTGIEVRVSSELIPIHETKQQYPTEIRTGNVTVSGTIDRAYINGAMLKLLLGAAAESRPAGAWVQPTFNILIQMANPANPDTSSTVQIHGVKFQNWSLHIPEEEFIMEKVEFLGLWISVNDEA